MCRFDGGDDALATAEQSERLHRLGVGDGTVLGAAGVFELCVLGPDPRVVEARRDRVRFDGLAVFVLQQVRVGALECAGCASGKCRGVSTGLDAVARGLEADEANLSIVEEGVEDSDGVGPATDTGGDGVG
ncbi:Uncharacterised protein [Mycobacteroides abscessus subsp. abscessus]|nr:Uncharacterised protein [Mycobacteroides abscessus subsp. abscessus]